MSVPIKNPNKSEAGSAIVGVLVAVALLSVVFMLYSGGSIRNLRAQKIVESKEKYSSIESALVNEIAGILRQLNKTSCLPMDTIQNRPFGYENSSTTLQYVTKLDLENPTQSVALTAAQRRCSQPVFITAGEVNNPDRAHLYFCLQFSPVAAAGPQAQKTFMEIAIDFEKTATDSKASCQQFIEDRSAIARISYGIYFSDKETSRKFGTAIAKSELTP